MSEQLTFDGYTFDQERDGARLTGQLGKVFECLSRGGWWSLRDLADRCEGSEAGVSARIRDLRKERFGGYHVERMNIGGGNWRYRLVKHSTEANNAL